MSFFSGIVKWFGNLFAGNKPSTDQQVEAIQRAAVAACGFLPLAETAVGIIAAGNPATLTAASVARYLCSIVQRPPIPDPTMGAGGAQGLLTPDNKPKIQTWIAPDGMTIRGSFIRK